MAAYDMYVEVESREVVVIRSLVKGWHPRELRG